MSLPEKLIKSAKAGNLREVRKMLGRNVQITKDKVGYCSRNNVHVKTSLCNQYTYIWRIHVCKKDLLYILKILQFGNTALHEAAWNGHSDIVKVLLNAFCFVDSINNSGFTPLHLASQNGHGKVVKTLLKWRADPSLLNQVCK